MDSGDRTLTRNNDEKEPKRNIDSPQPADEDTHAAERAQDILNSASPCVEGNYVAFRLLPVLYLQYWS